RIIKRMVAFAPPARSARYLPCRAGEEPRPGSRYARSLRGAQRRSNPLPASCIGGPVRLFCDEMLARLGRWLRAAGYDTALAEGGLADPAIIARCAAEGRTLLTRDRHLAAAAENRVSVLRLSETKLVQQAHTLCGALGMDW